MEALTQVKLRSLAPYRHLFPPVQGIDQTVMMGASVYDTVDLIPKVVKKCRWQVKAFVDQELRGLPLHDACKKLWHFVKYHIEYKKDKRGSEQVRTPRRLIHDAKGDCDCYTTFICACLDVLGVKGVINRITKYEEDRFQHIYPVVPLGNGELIVMDCVVPAFNYEEPYSEKRDYTMELQVLDGIDHRHSVDAQDLFDEDDLGALSLKNIGAGIKNAAQNVVKTVQTAAQNVAQTTQKVATNVAQNVQQAVKDPKIILNAVNKINPAVALLRVGFLGSMKLNLMNVAEKIRWAYLPKHQAEAKGIDPAKYDQLVRVKNKAEEIFYGAGGNKENLREAILTGKGNHDKQVAGLGMTRNNSLSEILGPLYYEEYGRDVQGVDGLGEPVTAAAIAAAASAVGALAILIKNIGDVFKKKQAEAAATPVPLVLEPVQQVSMVAPTSGDGGVTIPEGFSFEMPMENGSSSQSQSSSTSSGNTSAAKPMNTTQNSGSGSNLPAPLSNTTNTEGTFWEKNKTWIKPVGIGTVVVGAIVGGILYVKDRNKKANAALAGIGRHKKSKGKKSKRKHHHGKKTVMDLM